MVGLYAIGKVWISVICPIQEDLHCGIRNDRLL